MTLRILMIDESPDVAETVSQQLRAEGYDVLTASQAQQALALADEYAPDVIVLDTSAPDTGGFEVHRRLRMNPATAAIPVILVVPPDADDHWTEGRLVGAADYITRPINASELLARINRLMRYHGEVSPDHRRLLEGMAYTATTVLPCKLAWFLTVAPDHRWLVHEAVASDDSVTSAEQFYTIFHRIYPQNRIPLQPGEDAFANVVLKRSVLINMPVATSNASPGDNELLALFRQFKAAYISMLPLMSGNQVVGVMVLATDGLHLAQSRRIQQTLNAMTVQAAMAVDNARLLENLAQRNAQMQSEQAFRQLIIESMGQGLIVIDDQLAVIYVNNRLLMMTGYRRDAIYGQNVGLLFHPRSRERLVHGLKHRRSTLSFSQELFTRDGDTLPVLMSRVLAPAAEENVFVTVIVVTDLSELQRNEQALRLQTRRLQALNEATNAISSVSTIEDVIRVTLESALRVVEGVSATLLLRDPEHMDVLIPMYAVGPHAERIRQMPVPMDETLAGGVAATGQALLVSDFGAQPDLYVQCVQTYGVPLRTLVAVPLVAFDEVVGVIEVLDKAEGCFDEQDLAMLESLAGSAAITVENTRLYEQTRRRVTELSTLLDASSAVTSTLDFGDILERIARQLILALQVERVVIADWQRQPSRLVALAELVNAYWLPESGPTHHVLSLPLTFEAIRSRRAAFATPGSYEDTQPVMVERNSSGMRAVASFPLEIADQVVGAVTVYSEHLRGGPSAEQARIIQDAIVYWRDIVSAYNAAEWISRPNLTELCQRIVQVAAIRWCAVLVYDPDNGCLRVVRELGYALWPGRSSQVWHIDQYPILARVLETGEPYIAYVERLSDDSAEVEYWTRGGGHTCLLTPLFIRGESRGLVQLIDTEPNRVFDSADISLGQGIANVVGNAIENAQLYTAQRQRVSALEAAYKELQEADEMKEALLQNLSHELRTPLTHILGYLQLMLDDAFGGLADEQRQTLDLVVTKAEQLANLVKNIVSVQEAEQKNIVPKPIHLDRVIASAIRAVTAKAQEQNITIMPRIPGSVPLVYADPARIGAVFEELLDNAIKFSPPDSVIDILVKDPGGLMIQACVRDHGIGIAAGEHKKIFRRFYQVESGTTRRYSGTGLGLAIVRQVIEAHNGRVWVESEPGLGSCFMLTLPKARAMIDEA